ncbi:unnamed protein product [Chrysoparadoxa australica]
MEGVTAFQARVYALISNIPAGRVSTYGACAKQLQSSPRAVGQALKKNPFAPKVPCHRVVSSTLGLGGFHGQAGDCESTRRKRRMLEEEGIEFERSGSKIKSRQFLHDWLEEQQKSDKQEGRQGKRQKLRK